jgi:preprotein translocase subunit YajC
MISSTIWDVGSVFAMGPAPDGSSAWVQFVPFAIVLAIFYFIILMPMKRKQQKVTQFLDSLKVNDRIVTTGGIYGQITRLGEQSVQIQIADKVRIEVAKAAIGGYQGQEAVQEPAGERTSH